MRWFKHMTASPDELRTALGQLDKLIARRRYLLAVGADFTVITLEIMGLRAVIRGLEENETEQRWVQ